MLTLYLSMLETEEQQSKFELIYTEYSSLIFYEANRITQNVHTAQDIAQEVYLHIIQRIDIIRADNSKELASLIVLITRQRSLDMLRHLGHSFPTDDETVFEGASNDNTEEIALSAISYEMMYAAIEELNDTYRIPLKMKAAGYKATEIADLLSISHESARTRLHRGRKILQSRISRG